MAQTIYTNLLSLNAQRNLNATQSALTTAMQRLSSGLRVNSAKDDAAGLSISERMNAQIRGMNVAIRNANDGVSLAQTAEGALGRVSDILQRMRELAVQAENATNVGAADQASLNNEFSALNSEITRTLTKTTFNGISVLSSGAGTPTFQVGASNGDTVDIATTDMTNQANVSAVIALTAAKGSITTLDSAIDAVNSERAVYGTAQTRFESIIGSLQASSENLAAARSRIIDADFAQETANLSRTQILQQAGTAMVAQANQLPQLVLQLLK